VTSRRIIEVEGVAHAAPIPMACQIGNVLFTSAIMGKDPTTGEIPDDPDREIALVFQHLRVILDRAGMSPEDVGYVSILLADDAYRPIVNREWLSLFPDPESRPARHTSLTALPAGRTLQLIATAVSGENGLPGDRPLSSPQRKEQS